MDIKDSLIEIYRNYESYFWPVTDLSRPEVHFGIRTDTPQIVFEYRFEDDKSYIHRVKYDAGEETVLSFWPYSSKIEEHKLIKQIINLIQDKFSDDEFLRNQGLMKDNLVYRTSNFINERFTF